MKAYNDRPQRGRDACKNIFDTLESVAKVVFALPTKTLSDVLDQARRQQILTNETLSILTKLNLARDKHFGHGMTTQFALAPAEVDFIVTTCLGAILLFVRLKI